MNDPHMDETGADDTGAEQQRQHARAAALTAAVTPCLARLDTPALVIDLDAVEHNVAAMVRRVGDARRWRPHIKTIKQPTLVGLLLDAGVHRFKAATVAEVELVLEAAEHRTLPQPVDVLLAYPVAPPQLQAMLALRRAHPRAHLGLLADSPAHVLELRDGIGAHDELPALALWLDVDVGMHRTGSPPEVWRDAELQGSPWLVLEGLHGYEGHLQWTEREPAFRGYDALCQLATVLGVRQLCTSGTHGYAHALAHPGLAGGPWSHQVSPGTLVLSDRRSARAAADLGLEQAAFVCSRVVARPGDDRITLDAGSKAIAPDCAAPGCAVLGRPDWEPLTASEEHRPVRIPRGPRPDRGSLWWLVPDHVCTTVNLHAEVLYVRTNTVVGSAPVLARGHRPWLTPWLPPLGMLAALAALGPTTGCQPNVTEIDVQLVLPPDDVDLQRTNNVSVVLDPEGFSSTIATDGLDFALSFEVPPDGRLRTLSVYLAEDEQLLAWGGTPPFTYASAFGGLALLLARPGTLTPLDLEFTAPDAAALAAPVADAGVLVLASDGSALYLDAYQYTLQAAASLLDGPAASDGVLVGAADGGIVRVAWADGLAAWRFDAVANVWQALELEGDLRPRPDAAVWVSPGEGILRLFGGASALDVVELSLPGDEPRQVTVVEGLALDAPRPGAVVIELDGHPIVVGGHDPSLPLAWQADAARGTETLGAWTSMACAPLIHDPPQTLCMGGMREDDPTADALGLWIDDGMLHLEERSQLLPLPLSAPLVLSDDLALYAQGDGHWLRIARTDLAVTELPSPAPRASGGSVTPLPSGAMLLVGGLDVDGAPLEHWYAFAPTITP
ncbi:alanine racemase [Paraliomyxa miuraensis]|uniref:alanine racemase n=1 Tax=Paraliomyxa miuraensis TaxID=376150 RepID=UPI0022511E90|nr:alanine racemase [Paraliomyxa miuraensis]MCX4245928.1 alanine racemase [Paraliomyxa miuraensis]